MTYFLNLQAKRLDLKCPMVSLLEWLLLWALLVTVCSQSNPPIFQSEYYLLPNSRNTFISLNESILGLGNNTPSYLKIGIKIKILNPNGIYVEAPFQTGNILVKLWKNDANTPASQVLAYPYDKISFTKQFPSATDKFDSGSIDIEAVYNYQNNHYFLYPMNSQTEDLLFVLAIYRFSNDDLTQLMGMSSITDEIKIQTTVFRANPSQLNCLQCQRNNFCASKSCECYLQKYSDCGIKKKQINPKSDQTQKITEVGKLAKGGTNFFQIEPSTDNGDGQTDSFQLKFVISFSDSNQSRNAKINNNKIYLILTVHTKSQNYASVPNIYNFKVISSPSLSYKISNQEFNKLQISKKSNSDGEYVKTQVTKNFLYLNESLTISEDQFVSAAIYYLADDTTGPNQISHQIEMTLIYDHFQSQSPSSTLNIAFVFGMIAVGFIALILVVCFLHCLVSRRFRFFSVFSNSQSSNRTSLRPNIVVNQHNRNAQSFVLPQISFDFMKRLIFKPLNYFCDKNMGHRRTGKKVKSQGNFVLTSQVCSICLQQFSSSSRVKYTYCGHVIDSKCLQSWFQKQLSCPICRQTFQVESVQQYQAKIQAQINQKEQFEIILQDQIQTLKNLYTKWQNTSSFDYNSNKGFRQTQQSLVNNQIVLTNFKEEFPIANISTMIQLQKTQGNLSKCHLKSNKKSRKATFIQPEIQSKQCIKDTDLTYMTQIRNVFIQDSDISIRRFIKIYRFYRSIYLYHQNNRKFLDLQPDNNLYFEQKMPQKISQKMSHFEQAMSHFEQKMSANQYSMENQNSKGSQMKSCQSQNCRYPVEEQKQKVQFHQQTGRQNEYFEPEQINSSEHKLRSQKRPKFSRNYKRPSFRLDFDDPQLNYALINASQDLKNTGDQNPVIQLALQKQPNQIYNPSPTHNHSEVKSYQTIKIKQLSMREEMDELQRQLVKQEQQNRSHFGAEIIFMDDFNQHQSTNITQNPHLASSYKSQALKTQAETELKSYQKRTTFKREITPYRKSTVDPRFISKQSSKQKPVQNAFQFQCQLNLVNKKPTSEKQESLKMIKLNYLPNSLGIEPILKNHRQNNQAKAVRSKKFSANNQIHRNYNL